MSLTYSKQEMQILTARQNELDQSDNIVGNSQILIVRVDPNYMPASSRALPTRRCFKMNGKNAKEIALRLNREAMQDSNSQSWYVVVPLVEGFTVLRVVVPHDWEPQSETDSPPDYHDIYTNVSSKRTVKEFNHFQLERSQQTGEPVKLWAIHIKPLTEPAEVSLDCLSDSRREIAETLIKHLGSYRGEPPAKVVRREGEGTFVEFPESYSRIDLAGVSAESVASILRERAERLLQAAAKLSAEPTPQLEIVQPFYEVRVDNSDYVSLMLMNCDSEEEALRRGSQFLARLKHSERLTQESEAA